MIEIVPGPPLSETEADRLVLPVLAGRVWGPGVEDVLPGLGGDVVTYLEREGFEGKSGEAISLPGGSSGFGDVLFVGLGEEVDLETLRRAAGVAARRSARHDVVATTLHLVGIDGAVEAVALGYALGAYRFDRYRTDREPRRNTRLLLPGVDTDAEVGTAAVVAAAVALARDLTNEPAAAKAPAVLAERARELSPRVEVEVYDEEAIVARGFGGVAAVGAGAGRPPRVVVLRYEPEDAVAFLGLVGKGIVFDSGGLSLKPAAAMETMKTDMAGAAAVFGAMQAIARLHLPVRVLGVTPLAENMPGGAAQRPGDVLRVYGGTTIEVLNTDAEGRLVLADGLAYVAEAAPDLIVDLATLTGACKVALGPAIAGLFGNDEEAVALVEAAAAAAGEKVWRLPLEGEYRTKLDSPVADLKNIGDRFGGAITAALLLREFVADRPWVHLDIAGPARAEKDEHYVARGGTGFGVRLLVEVARGLATA